MGVCINCNFKSFFSCHCVPCWNLSWGLINVSCFKRQYLLFICLWFKKSKEKDFYQSQSDKCNPIMKINPLLILHHFKRMGLYVCVNYTQHTHGTCSNSASKLSGQQHQDGMFSRGLARLGVLGLQRKPRASGKGGSQEATGSPMTLAASQMGGQLN